MLNGRKILFISILALATFCSCNKVDTAVSSYSVAIDFIASGVASKATTSYPGEDVINDVKLFVDQVEQTSGATTRFAEYYTTTGNIRVDLKFPEGTCYRYIFRAYANFGDVDSVPEIIEYAECFDNGIKMYAEKTLAESDIRAGEVRIPMKRCVGKVTINSISSYWNDESGNPLEINAIYVSNAGKDNNPASESFYNPEGVVNCTEKEVYLYDAIDNVTIGCGERYNYQHHFYGFNGHTSDNPTAIVIEATYNDQKMYYQIEVNLGENLYTIYDFIIVGPGNDKLYGSKIDLNPSIVSMESMISVEGWTVSNEKIYSGEGVVDNWNITLDTEPDDSTSLHIEF